MEKCLYGGNASKANKTNYHTSLLHNQLTFYIVTLKKNVYTSNVYFILQSAVGWDGRLGGLGKGQFIQKKNLYAHYKCFSGISGSYQGHR